MKEVRIWDRRYVVCLNEDQAAKDAADREAILAGLRGAAQPGRQGAGGQQGLPQVPQDAEGQHFEIDEDKIAEEARYDGKWVLLTDLDWTRRRWR